MSPVATLLGELRSSPMSGSGWTGPGQPGADFGIDLVSANAEGRLLRCASRQEAMGRRAIVAATDLSVRERAEVVGEPCRTDRTSRER